jgi:hypothetical protein
MKRITLHRAGAAYAAWNGKREHFADTTSSDANPFAGDLPGKPDGQGTQGVVKNECRPGQRRELNQPLT